MGDNGEEVKYVFDENPDVQDSERLPVSAPLKVLRYRTIKKSKGFGWWSAIVLVKDHDKKQICFYRWRRVNGDWRRDKKLPFHDYSEWKAIRGTVDEFFRDVD